MLAPFSFSAELMKIVLSVISVSVIFIIYEFAFVLTKDEESSLYSAIIGSIVPAYFGSHIGSIDPLILFIPLLFLHGYLFIAHDTTIWRHIILLVALTLLSPLTIIIPLTYAVYFALLSIERMRVRRMEQDLALFSCFFIVLVLFFVYRAVLATHESATLSGNIPSALVQSVYGTLSVGLFVYSVGFVPFVAGIWIISRYLFMQKHRIIYYLTSLSIVCVVLLFTRLIVPTVGFSILGICMSILYAKAYQLIRDYFHTTRAHKHWKWIRLGSILIVLFTSGLSSITSAAVEMHESITDAEYYALEWIANNTPPDATILAYARDGHLITALAHRKNFIDSRYFLVDADSRYDEHTQMLTVGIDLRALELMTAHNITYIYYSDAAKTAIGRDAPLWASNDACFPVVYRNMLVTIYARSQSCVVGAT